jgi:hypothetical protein
MVRRGEREGGGKEGMTYTKEVRKQGSEYDLQCKPGFSHV